jgi:hypothetical protein
MSTKGPLNGGCQTDAFFITLGGPQAHDSSSETVRAFENDDTTTPRAMMHDLEMDILQKASSNTPLGIE